MRGRVRRTNRTGLTNQCAAAQEDGEVDELLAAVERALAAELRPADQLLRDAPGRYWVTAPDTGPAVGRLLAERLAEAAASAATHHHVPLTLSIGVATCPEDGEDAELPAPVLQLAPAEGDGHGGGGSADPVTDVETSPVAAETDAGGTSGVAVAALVVASLALVAALGSLVLGRRRA